MKTGFLTNEFEFRKDRRQLVMGAWEGAFPMAITIESVLTGKSVAFVVDEVTAIRNEYWDGEMIQYIPANPDLCPNVATVVIHRHPE